MTEGVEHAEHPSVDEILAGSSAARAHVARCAACSALASIAEPVRNAAAGVSAGGELPVVERNLYADFEELSDRRGGMGRIFRARDTRLGRVVVIKQLHEDAGGPRRDELRRRFEREARLAACLEHPAIVCVHEAGRWRDGEPFYAMRFVIGVPLDEEIARRKTMRDRVALLTNLTVVADALAYAHERRIVHRDVKPRNVVLGRFGETVLVDWGLAKHLDAPAEPSAPSSRDATGGLTQLGIGTAQYMPPEQARGAPAVCGWTSTRSARRCTTRSAACRRTGATPAPPRARACSTVLRAPSPTSRPTCPPSCARSWRRQWTAIPRAASRARARSTRSCTGSSTGACSARTSTRRPSSFAIGGGAIGRRCGSASSRRRRSRRSARTASRASSGRGTAPRRTSAPRASRSVARKA